MSGTHNKNLLFYSLYPNDKISRQCLEALESLPELNRQFVKFCVHDPKNLKGAPLIKLPKIVYSCMERGLVPIIAVAGFNQPVFADAALSWIKQSALTKSGIMPSNIHGQGAADNCSTIEQASRSGNTLFETDYNIGFSDGEGEFNKDYASIAEACQSHIVTYDEVNDRSQASQEIQSRLDQMKFKRDMDVPQTKRIGGDDMPQMPQFSYRQGQQGQMGGMPQMPQMPQYQNMGMPQMPQYQNMGMPQMPQMPQYQNMGMPQMPQYQMPQRQLPPPQKVGRNHNNQRY
jgi:hypothetical protein